ncbi:helix-turn-helix domain-containing protein [Cupriavidus basilensis]
MTFRIAQLLGLLQRGLEVLGAFRADRKALSNTEIVRRTGLSKAIVSR